MKKKLLTFLLSATMAFCVNAQNPTIVRSNNGLTNYNGGAIAGQVTLGLNTNLTGFAANTAIKWDGSAFVWDAFGGSGLPTNWTWSAADPSILTNSIVGGVFSTRTGGRITNECSGYMLQVNGTGTIGLGGNGTFNDLLRDANGWGLGSTRANAAFTIGASLALRQAIYNSTGNVNSGDNGIINYCDASGGPITLTLPAVGSNPNKIFSFQKYDITTNGVTFVGAEQGYVLRSKGDVVVFHCDNSANVWRVQSSQSYPKFASRFHHEDTIVTGAAYLSAPDTLNLYNFVTYQNPAATNDLTRGFVNLKAGTYTFSALGIQNSNGGIQTVLVDDVSVGTIDWYAGVIARNVQANITGITITNSGTHKVEFLMRSKNASSSDFFLVLQKTWWTWTGD